MPIKRSFIPADFRPAVRGGRLNPEENYIPFDFSSSTQNTEISSIVVGPQNDFVVKLIEQRVSADSAITFLYYEDLGSLWTYTLTDGHLEFYYLSKRIIPKRVYIRGVVVEPEDSRFQKISNFMSCINSWPGEVICRPSNQLANESKVFQCESSIRAAWVAIGQPESIQMIPSLICLGKEIIRSPVLSKTLSNNRIVKSLSGIRSLVASNETFKTWNWEALLSTPGFFQERISGFDLRVHYFRGKFWALKVQSKSEVDYRYASNRSEMEPHEIPEILRAFCKKVAELEKNDLIGFDFLVVGDTYYCLEANPGPGWAWYHEHEKCSEPFVETFLGALLDPNENQDRGFKS
jgi:hypothetical protein